MSNFPLFYLNYQKKESMKKKIKPLDMEIASLGKVECSSMQSLSNFMNIICNDLGKSKKPPLPIKKSFLPNLKSSKPINILTKLDEFYKEINYTEPKTERQSKTISFEYLNKGAKYHKKNNLSSSRCCLTQGNDINFKIKQIRKMINKSIDNSINNTRISTSYSDKLSKEPDDFSEVFNNLNIE